jgi:hypothetical protein
MRKAVNAIVIKDTMKTHQKYRGLVGSQYKAGCGDRSI